MQDRTGSDRRRGSRRWKWIGLAFIALLAVPASQKAARAEGPLDTLAYTVRAVYEAPGGERLVTEMPAIQNLPVLIDADHNVATGLAGADVLAQLQIDAGRATLRVTKQANTPAVFPMSIEAILPDPRRGIPIPILGEPDDRLRIAFGYDALDSTIPTAYDATLAIAGADRVSSFSMDLHTAGAGAQLGVTAEVYSEGDGGERLDPIRGRVDYAPVPAVAHFGIVFGEDIGVGVGAGQAALDLTSDVPTVVNVLIEDIRGSAVTRIRGTIDRLPNSLSIVQTDVEGTGQQTFTYRATGRVATIDLRITAERNAQLVQETLLQIEDMATNAILVQDRANHATLTTDSPIGSIVVGLSTGGAAVLLEDAAYAHLFERDGVSSLSFRVRGLTRAEITTGDPFEVSTTMTAGPFRVLIVDGSTTIDGRILDLPASVTIAGSPSAGTLDYEGSAPVERITVAATDPNGFFGSRATRADLLLQSVPTRLSLDYGTDSGTVSLAAGGSEIGLAELSLTSGPDRRLADEYDGVLYEDLASHFAVFARITRLRSVAAHTGGDEVGLDIDSQSSRILRIDYNSLNGNGNATYVRASIDHLVPLISLRYNSATGQIRYSGGAPIDAIDIDAYDPDGLVGRATLAHVIIRDIPTAMNLTVGRTGTNVAFDAGGATIGLVEAILTSGPDERLVPTVDGILVRDTADRYVVFGRVTQLKRIAVATTAAGAIDLQLDTGTTRLFLVDIEQRNAAGQPTYLRATVDSLVPNIRAGYDPDAGRVTYTGGATVNRLLIDAYDPAGLVGRATRAQIDVRSIPTGLTLTFGDGGTNASLDAGGATVGLFKAKLSSDPNAADPIAGDGLVVHDTASTFLVYGHVTGLRRVVVEQGPPPSFTLETTGGRPFVVDVAQQKPSGVATTAATIENLASSVTVQFTGPTQLAYRASAPVSRLTLDAFDPDGISGRAKWLRGTLTGMPVAMDVSLASTGAVTLDALGGTVGQIELQLTSGPDERISPATDDGILFKDITDRYVAFVRLTSLRKVTAQTRPLPDLYLNSTGGRVFRVDINSMDGLKVVYVRGTLDRLVPAMRVQVVDTASGQEIRYTASARTNSLVIDTNSGDRRNMRLSIAPLPTSLLVCQASNGACSSHGAARAGSIRIDASEHLTLNLFDDVGPGEFTRVENMYVRYLEQDADVDGVIIDGERGYIYVDTNNHEMRGYLLNENSSGGGFEVNLPPGFRAENRKGSWTVFGLFKDKTGSITCPGGTSLRVRVIGIWLGVTSYLC